MINSRQRWPHPPRTPCSRSRAAMGAVLLLSCVAPVVRGQGAALDDTLGTLIRLHRTRDELRAKPKDEPKRTGMIIRQQGARQRVDMLASLSDTVGAQWGTVTQDSFGMLVHDRARRTSLSMKLADLRELLVRGFHMEADSLVAEADVLGPGPAMLGYATVHVRFQRRFVMRTTWNHNVQRTVVTTTSDEFVAPALPASAGANTVLSMTAASSAGLVESVFGVGAADVRVRGAARLPVGLVLRSVSRSLMVSTGAAVSPLLATGNAESTDSVEVVAVERRAFPAALFDPPDGYEQLDLATQLRGMLSILEAAPTLDLKPPIVSTGKQSKAAKPIKP